MRVIFVIFSIFFLKLSSASACSFPFGIEPKIYVQEWWRQDVDVPKLLYKFQNRTSRPVTVSLQFLKLSNFLADCTPIFEMLAELKGSSVLPLGDVTSLDIPQFVLPEVCVTSLCLVRLFDNDTKQNLGYLHAPRVPVVAPKVGAIATCAGANVGAIGCAVGVIEPEYDVNSKFTGVVFVHLDSEILAVDPYEIIKARPFDDALHIVSVDSETLEIRQDEKSFRAQLASQSRPGRHTLRIHVSDYDFKEMRFFYSRQCVEKSNEVCTKLLASFFLVPFNQR